MEFQKAYVKDLGGGDLQDEVYAAKFLEGTGYVDPKKIGITGGSYGGFMTLMAIGKTPDVWAAGVEMFGIINWLTMIQHEDPFLQHTKNPCWVTRTRIGLFMRRILRLPTSKTQKRLC